jgi:hypothetical protein
VKPWGVHYRNHSYARSLLLLLLLLLLARSHQRPRECFVHEQRF